MSRYTPPEGPDSQYIVLTHLGHHAGTGDPGEDRGQTTPMAAATSISGADPERAERRVALADHTGDDGDQTSSGNDRITSIRRMIELVAQAARPGARPPCRAGCRAPAHSATAPKPTRIDTREP